MVAWACVWRAVPRALEARGAHARTRSGGAEQKALGSFARRRLCCGRGKWRRGVHVIAEGGCVPQFPHPV